MAEVKRGLRLLLALFGAASPSGTTDSIPLPEHPRPDFQRSEWLNLNGRWQFAFDPQNRGERESWPSLGLPAGRQILVPFSWGAPLSGAPDSGDIGWYARHATATPAWRGRRVFLVFGASDWPTTAWLHSRKVGEQPG